jgi:hypothetical protein
VTDQDQRSLKADADKWIQGILYAVSEFQNNVVDKGLATGEDVATLKEVERTLDSAITYAQERIEDEATERGLRQAFPWREAEIAADRARTAGAR